MKRYISELSLDELSKIFDANDKLRDDVLDDMIESEMFWIGEQLDCFRDYLSDYSVGTCSHVYIDVQSGKEEQFVDGVIQMQKDYCVLHDSENDFIAEIVDKIEVYNDAEMYSDEYYELENQIEEMSQLLADKIAKEFKSTLDGLLDYKLQEEYFCEFYAEERIADCYILADNDDYVLYKDITEKYAN